MVLPYFTLYAKSRHISLYFNNLFTLDMYAYHVIGYDELSEAMELTWEKQI
jgi:hypothetical protein